MPWAGAIGRYWGYAVAVGAIALGVALLVLRVEGPPPPPPRLAYRIAPNDKIRLAGGRRLLVGDSLCADWPGQEHDAVIAPNVRAEYITKYASGYAHAAGYDEVIVWLGADHLMQGHDAAALRENIRALVENLGDTPYVVLGPVPPRAAAPELRAAFDEVNAYLAATYPRAYVDVVATLALDGAGARFRRDDTRLIPEAYARLQGVIDARFQAASASQAERRAAVFWGQHDPVPDRYGWVPPAEAGAAPPP